MCNQSCIKFGETNLKEEEVKGKSVIEVGALNINGSLRSVVEKLLPACYIGVDLEKGSGVDQICNAKDILNKFGPESFDLLICNELLEHIMDWRLVISNFKNILKPHGIIVVTTRSKGYEYHGAPFDFWRYELEDMSVLFSDFIIEELQKDSLMPGVFIKAKKPIAFTEKDLSNYQLYSIIDGQPVKAVKIVDAYWFFAKNYGFKSLIRKITSQLLPSPIKHSIKKYFLERRRKQNL